MSNCPEAGNDPFFYVNDSFIFEAESVAVKGI